MNDNPLTDVGEQLYELGKDTGKKFVRDVVKGVPRAAKGQIVGPSSQQGLGNLGNLGDLGEKTAKKDSSKKVDPVTGKPVPSQKVVSQLSQQVKQLSDIRMKKVREELEKQRLKTTQPGQAGGEGKGPEVSTEKAKPKDDVVSQMLKKSQSTAEMKGGVGG